MPDRATIEAATPKCSCSICRAAGDQRCATPMHWDHGRGVWVCARHPHMETAPDGSVRLAPKDALDEMFARMAGHVVGP